MLSILNALGTFTVGFIGWFAAHFVGKPILGLEELRGQIHEELYFTSSIGWINADGTVHAIERERYQKAITDLRRFAARVDATAARWPSFLKWYLYWRRIDLQAARKGLVGLSNSIADPAHHVQFTNQVLKALGFPAEYSADFIQNLRTVSKSKGTD